jgi:hypothetical protein
MRTRLSSLAPSMLAGDIPSVNIEERAQPAKVGPSPSFDPPS